MPSPPTWRLLNGATTIKNFFVWCRHQQLCVNFYSNFIIFLNRCLKMVLWFYQIISSVQLLQLNLNTSQLSNRNIDNQHTLILILKNHVLTSSPSSYGSRIPWTPLCLPCSPCTGRTAPRCTGSTPAPEPAPHHQPPPSRRQRVKRPTTCHKALPSDTHMSLWVGGHGGLRCRPACVCVWRRCVRADGWKRTELCTALRLRAVYVHFDNSLYTVQLPLHGALSLSPPTPPSPI